MIVTFNSIEWIHSVVRMPGCLNALTSTFNSIEWIHSGGTKVGVGITKVDTFNSIEWIQTRASRTQPGVTHGRLSIPLNGFMDSALGLAISLATLALFQFH